MKPPDSPYFRLDAALRRLRWRWLVVEGAAASAIAGAAILTVALTWLAAEAVFYLPTWVRLLAGPAAALAGSAAALWQLWRHLGHFPSLRRVALLAEARCPVLAQRLIAAWELHPLRDQRHLSPSLLDAAAREAADLLDASRPAAVVPAARLRRPLAVLATAGAVAALSMILAGGHLLPALDRSLHPTVAYERPRRTHLAVEPGNLEVVRGDEPSVELHLSGSIPPTAVIRRRFQDSAGQEGPWVDDEVVLDRHSLGGAAIDAEADTVRYSFDVARQSFSYQVVAGDARSPVYRVEVIEPPVVQRLRLALRYPGYSGLAPRVEEVSGDVRALAGTDVRLEIWANKALAEATVIFTADDSVRSRLPGQVRDARASATWQLLTGDGGTYHIGLIDRRGIANRDPIRYAIQVLADGQPEVSIAEPGRDTDLPESQQAAVSLVATDDFGIAEVSLVYRINEGAERRLRLEAGAGPEIRLTYLWDLAGLGLLPEDRVYYRAEVVDNDAVTGPKRAASAEYAFRYPSLYELYDELSQDHGDQVEALEELAREEGAARQYIEQLRREVLKSEELSWEQKKELEATLEAEQERARALEDLAEKVAETVEKLQEHGLAPEEMADKLEEIRQLMAAVSSPELQEALADLQQRLEDLKPEDIAAALDEFASDQKAFEERLDRTLALLRQVHAEQRLEAAARRAADLHDRQARIGEELSRAPDGASADALDRLEEQEGSLRRDTGRLQSELEDLGLELGDLSPPVGGGLEDAAGQMEENRLSGRMGEMQEELRSRQRAAAQRTGAGLEEDLGKLAMDLNRLQGQFMAEQKRELAVELRRAMADLLHLSHRQEALAGRTAQQPSRAKESPAELATEQYALYQGTGIVVADVARTGQRTLTLSMGLAATLGRALQQMERAATHLGQRDPVGAGPRQTSATGFLNEAIALLRQSAENLEQAGTPSGFAEAMQKMMGLSEQQAALNQATQQALGDGSQAGKQGRGRGDLRQQMARLAAEQRRIYQALSELERGVRGHRGMEKRLEQIRRDMEGVLREMEGNRPRPDLAGAQERILQRMLDAGRSIHTRGFEKKRRSETGGDVAYEGPAWLPMELGQSRDRLREAMRAALAADHPHQYRLLIRRYFELLYGDLGRDYAPLGEGEARP